MCFWNHFLLQRSQTIDHRWIAMNYDMWKPGLTSDTLFAIKTKSLTVKCFTYRIYLKYRDTLFNRNLAVDIKWFFAHIAWRFTCTVWRLHFTVGRLDKLTAVHCKRQTSTRTSSDRCPKLFPISDNVSVVKQGVLMQHFRFLQ